jgi:hypothetical protein
MFDYQARLEAVTDGDTIRVLVDHGMFIRSTQAIRLLGVFAPERSQPGGRETTSHVIAWFDAHRHGPATWPLRLRTEKDKLTFNRYVGSVACAGCGECLNVSVTEYVAAAGWGGGTGSPQ